MEQNKEIGDYLSFNAPGHTPCISLNIWRILNCYIQNNIIHSKQAWIFFSGFIVVFVGILYFTLDCF